MVTYTYPAIKSLVDFQKDFARKINAPLNGNYLELPSSFANGYLYADEINDDISFFIVDRIHNDDFHIRYDQSANNFGLFIFFIQLDVSSYMRLLTCGQDITSSNKTSTSVYLTYTHQRFDFLISKGSHSKVMGIMIKLDVMKRLVETDTQLAIQLYTGKGIVNDNPDFINEKIQSIVNEIFNSNKKDELSELILQNRILLLLETFFSTLLLTEPKPSSIKKEDIEKLKTIEQKLKSDELEEFPSVEELSKMALMSATKLKNKFKEVYGMKLYEYYNHYRLQKAKRMIQNEKTTVKEVAYSIGYSNISNFSKAFKKEFGVFPSALKQ